MTIRREQVLIGAFALQALCVVFLLGDAVMDLFGYEGLIPGSETDTFEYLVVLALIAGTVFMAMEVYRLVGRNRRVEDQLKAASGAFSDLLDAQFDAWELTDAERDVALLSIKGLSISDMARLRDTKTGTIKSQSNAVYRKAGVTGRPQLISLFVEELMADKLIGDRQS